MATPDDEDLALQSVAMQSMQSILQARVRAEQELREAKDALEEETRVLEILNAMGTKLASNLDLQTVVQSVTDAATELTGAQFGAFFYTLSDDQGEVWTLYALSGAPREAFSNFPHPRATPLFGPTFRGEGVIRSGDVQQDPRYGQWAPHHGLPAGHLPVRSYLAVPVVSRGGHVLGGLFFGHAATDAFTERAERLAVGIASHAAIAIDNARLYESARRAAEERAQLLEAERAARSEIERISVLKDEFLATLSHELRTPLNAIFGWSRILLHRLRDAPDETRRGIETIVRNAQAQVQLIDDLLDMNRIVSGKIRLDVQAVELGPIVIAAIEAVRPSAAAKEIRIRATIDPTPGPALADPNRIQQVVWNLLSNAVKFTPKEGTIDVILQRINSHFEIIVQDSGVGIPASFLPFVFDRFRQADASTTRNFGGLGIGLSIAKQLVELHGGTIRVESPGENQGTTFFISLPLRAVRDRVEGGVHPTTSSAIQLKDFEVSLSGLAVLVVDDQEDARELIRSVLTTVGARVLTAASSDEGFEVFCTHRPDVLISDIGMPERDGYELIRAIRKLSDDRGGRTPAVAVTAFARTEDRTRAMLAGYQVHLTKPIEPQELVATIRSVANSAVRHRPSPQDGPSGA